MENITPKHLIDSLRQSDRYIQDIFMRGSCYRFHLFLKELFPSALPYLNDEKNHVASLIDGELYDIRGKVEEKYKGLYSPLRSEDLELVQEWSFHQNMLISVGECPVCEEPIVADR